MTRWTLLVAAAMTIGVALPGHAQDAVDPVLKRYADQLQQLFNNHPPPVIYPSVVVFEAVRRRREQGKPWRIPGDPDAAQPRTAYYDELRAQFEAVGIFVPRADDYRNLIACMALPDHAGQVEEYARRVQRINFARLNAEWRTIYNSKPNRQDFCGKNYPVARNATDIEAIVQMASCMTMWTYDVHDTIFRNHLPAATQAITYWYRPMEFCLANVRSRDFTREVPFKID